jgi:dTDP-4-dehydrorhamnose 3,5-epimerase
LNSSIAIEGVKVMSLTTHSDQRGFFREVFRFNEQFENVPVGQLSHSLVDEGVVKGWHGHVYQYQWNYVVLGKINVALYDNREESATYRELIEFTVGGEDTLGYFFPPGVLHGYRCVSGPMQIIYATSGVYDLEDEIREKISYVSQKNCLIYESV